MLIPYFATLRAFSTKTSSHLMFLSVMRLPYEHFNIERGHIDNKQKASLFIRLVSQMVPLCTKCLGAQDLVSVIYHIGQESIDFDIVPNFSK